LLAQVYFLDLPCLYCNPHDYHYTCLQVSVIVYCNKMLNSTLSVHTLLQHLYDVLHKKIAYLEINCHWVAYIWWSVSQPVMDCGTVCLTMEKFCIKVWKINF
jgi:hypothetical protein